jgi:plastocyanin
VGVKHRQRQADRSLLQRQLGGRMPGIIIRQEGNKVVFEPDRPDAKPGDPLQVIQGDLVVWNNRTAEIHHPVAITGPFLTDEVAPGRASDPLFNVTQAVGTTITYICSHHPDDPNEKGTIQVT